LEIGGIDTVPYALEQLPDVFRYDRNVPAYGINCGVNKDDDGSLTSVDDPSCERMRPAFWPGDLPEPKFRFDVLAVDPSPLARELAVAVRRWGEENWSAVRLEERRVAERWSDEVAARAGNGARDFWREVELIDAGVEVLASNAEISRAFRAMNAA